MGRTGVRILDPRSSDRSDELAADWTLPHLLETWGRGSF